MSDEWVSNILFCFRMRYVAAYLLAVLGGNTSPSAKDIKNILGSVGIETDDDRLNKVFNFLLDVQIFFALAYWVQLGRIVGDIEWMQVNH